MGNVNNIDKHLVLIPGLNNTGEIWDRVGEHLPPTIHCEKVTCPAIANVNEIAKKILDALPDKFYLGGFSFGGFIALAMLAMAPERIQGLALIATSVTADTEQRKIARKKAITRAQTGEYEQMINSQVEKIFHPDHLDKPDFKVIRERMLKDYGVERFIAHQEASMERPDFSEIIARFTKPILIVTGKEDQVFSVETQRNLAKGLEGSLFHEIARSGHMLPLEQPEELAFHLQTWMNS